MLNTGKIYGINGPVIYLKGNTGFRMSEMVYVGKQQLVGEVIALDKDRTTIQVMRRRQVFAPARKSWQAAAPSPSLLLRYPEQYIRRYRAPARAYSRLRRSIYLQRCQR